MKIWQQMASVLFSDTVSFQTLIERASNSHTLHHPFHWKAKLRFAWWLTAK